MKSRHFRKGEGIDREFTLGIPTEADDISTHFACRRPATPGVGPDSNFHPWYSPLLVKYPSPRSTAGGVEYRSRGFSIHKDTSKRLVAQSSSFAEQNYSKSLIVSLPVFSRLFM